MCQTSRKQLKELLKPWRRKGVVLSGLTALSSVLLVALALVSQKVLDSAMGLGSRFTLWCVALGLLAVGIPVLNGITNAWSERLTDQGLLLLQQISMQRLGKKDCAGLEPYHSGQIFSRLIGDCRMLCQRYTVIFPATVGQLIRLGGALIALAVLAPMITGVVLAAGCLAMAVASVLRGYLKRKHKAVLASGDRLTSELQESLEHLELRRSAVDPVEGARRLRTYQERWRQDRARLRLVTLGGSTGFSVLVQLVSAALLIWGGVAIGTGGLTFGGLTALLQLANLFRTPVAGLSGLHSRLAAVDAAEDRVLELWDLADEPDGERPPEGAVCKAIHIRNVTFCYPGEERPVFQNLNASVNLSGWTCLTGSSGRGKSTLYRLILGFYRPQEGEIVLETDQGCFPCSAATRHLFSLVPQTPVLFSGTLRENLLLACPHATEAELQGALKLAQCGFVDSLPQKLDTLVGEGGEGLSVGQRQRITIARALLSGAQVLLLDESTSALDRDTEMQVWNSLTARWPVAIAATHRQDVFKEIPVRHLNLNASY